jgi:N utilization substance protein B
MQLLFQSEITGDGLEWILAEGLCVEEVGLPCDFTRSLLDGVQAHIQEIDELIVQTSENWTLERMPLVDRSILRLATYEMLCVEDIPFSVSINEAVELAKRFGGEDESSRFVNGVLGRIAAQLDPDGSRSQSARAKAKGGGEGGAKDVASGDGQGGADSDAQDGAARGGGGGGGGGAKAVGKDDASSADGTDCPEQDKPKKESAADA